MNQFKEKMDRARRTFLRRCKIAFYLLSFVIVVAGVSTYMDTDYGIWHRSDAAAESVKRIYTVTQVDEVAHRSHTVRKGETVFSISQSYGVDKDILATVNNLSPEFRILAGQKLIIPNY